MMIKPMSAIRRFFGKPFRWAALYGMALTLFFAFTLLDAFVIPKALVKVHLKAAAQATDNGSGAAQAETEDDPQPDAASPQAATPAQTDPVITATSYENGNIHITIETVREYDTTFYVADVVLSDASLLKTALAGDVYGRNIKDTPSDMTEEHNAIFAINGDYYGFRDYGYVIRNGVLYRNAANAGTEALVIDEDGNFSIAAEGGVSAESLMESDAWQVLSFGPALVEDGEIAVGVNEEISGKSSGSNPRTAIGQIGQLHYLFIVSDGRTSSDAGLSLYQLAEQFYKRGCTVAYNLDGGGSSSMVFNGEIVNTTVSGGGKGGKGGKSGGNTASVSERQVSDIVYIGYE
jgi:exopolysaccharide biosynthesis protein